MYRRERRKHRFPRHIVRVRDGNRYTRREKEGFLDSRGKPIPLRVIADIMLDGEAKGYATSPRFTKYRRAQRVKAGA